MRVEFSNLPSNGERVVRVNCECGYRGMWHRPEAFRRYRVLKTHLSGVRHTRGGLTVTR